jgi:hypothetical protein
MSLALVSQLLLLVIVANGAPVLAKRFLGDAFSRPIDGGALHADGRPLLGASKTWRGVILAVSATAFCALLVGQPALVGALVGVGAMAGDLLSSYVKRRLGRPVSSRASGLDQIPEALVPLLAVLPLTSLTFTEIVVIVAVFFFAGVILSRLLFELRVRDQPF